MSDDFEDTFTEEVHSTMPIGNVVFFDVFGRYPRPYPLLVERFRIEFAHAAANLCESPIEKVLLATGCERECPAG